MKTEPTKQWRHEASTQSIRSVPENYWIASMDSTEGAVDHEANAKLIAAAPELLEALRAFCDASYSTDDENYAEIATVIELAHEAINKAV